ncbi:MAG: TolC family protein [Myxococcales bacterium]|nr:TolC family protein [Myxococcales bacterium]
MHRIIAAALLLALSLPAGAHAQRRRRRAKKTPAGPKITRVGVLTDGPLKPEWARLLARLEKETTLVLGKSRPLEFPKDKRLSADWDVAKARANADKLLADADVDMVIALGFLVAIEAASRRDLKKPVLVPLAPASRVFGLPFDRKRKVSGKKNFTYLTYPNAFSEDLHTFKQLFPFTTVYVLVDKLALDAAAKKADGVRARLQKEHKCTIKIVPVGASAKSALDALPATASAVYITPLSRMSDAERKRLFAALTERKARTFSMTGRAEVERGVLATQARGMDMLRAARRTAINIERIVRKEKPETFPVLLRRRRKLLINMTVARAIGYSPSWQVRTYAELYAGRKKRGRKLTMLQAVKEAIARSYQLAAARQGLAAQRFAVKEAYSKLGPRVDFTFQHTTIRKEVAEKTNGSQPWHQGKLAASVQQFLFIEPVLANITAQKHLRRAQQRDIDAQQLDVAAAAARAYINLLKARAGAEIRRGNAQLTAENLEAAQVRQQVGTSGPSDLYRWQSQLANDRNLLIGADTQVQVAQIALNRLLVRPQNEALLPADLTTGDPTIISREKELVPYIENPLKFGIFSDFLVSEGLRNSPELRGLDASIAAQKRVRLSRSRALWLPQLSLQGEVSYVPYRKFVDVAPLMIPGLGTFELNFNQPRFQWYVGVGLRLPIFTAFEQTYQRDQQDAKTRQLMRQRDAVKLQIEQRVRSALAQTRAARAGIFFATRAADAASKNFKVMLDGYQRGVTNTILLLDAQNQKLLTRLAAATATYDFFATLIELQRASAAFEMFRDKAARDAWFGRLERFYKERRKQGVPR